MTAPQPSTLAEQQQVLRDALDVLALRGEQHSNHATRLRMVLGDHDADGDCPASSECYGVGLARQILAEDPT